MATVKPGTLIDQINTELVSIRKKLSGASDIGALLVTLTANIATTQTVMDLINDAGNAGTGLGPIATMPSAQDLETWMNAAIAAET